VLLSSKHIWHVQLLRTKLDEISKYFCHEMQKYGTKTSSDAKLEQSTVLKIVSQENYNKIIWNNTRFVTYCRPITISLQLLKHCLSYTVTIIHHCGKKKIHIIRYIYIYIHTVQWKNILHFGTRIYKICTCNITGQTGQSILL
jgi:hypothetical protein